MSEKTNIQWCDSSANIEMGCDGCELVKGQKKPKCYAKIITDPKAAAGLKGWPDRFEHPTLFLERLPKVLKWKDLTGTPRADKPWIPLEMPRLIFLNDMGDSFSPSLPLDWMAPILPQLAATPHQYLVLTKWPQRFAAFSRQYALPKNVWPGTTVTSQATAFRIKWLAEIRGGGPKFVSAEPLWGSVDWAKCEGIDAVRWFIFGGESGSQPEPFKIEWLNDGLAFCNLLGIAPFVKQVGAKPIVADLTHWRCGKTTLPDFSGYQLHLRDSHGGNWDEWPEDFKVREFPNP